MEKQKISLPENAQRELAPGEEYRPILGAEKTFKEVTAYSVGGALFGRRCLPGPEGGTGI